MIKNKSNNNNNNYYSQNFFWGTGTSSQRTFQVKEIKKYITSEKNNAKNLITD